ncbi:MAG: preprotein translocase subunit SecG [Alistipes sp.]|nr:preprotein translocase subunit SecG [Alistipes sp.]
MYIFCIILILIASGLLILAVLAQNPKSGMAANFGASNQVMGVRQTADFLEKFTWGLAISIVVLSLVATMTMPSARISTSKSGVEKALEQSVESNQNLLPNAAAPAAATEAPATEAPAAADSTK